VGVVLWLETTLYDWTSVLNSDAYPLFVNRLPEGEYALVGAQSLESPVPVILCISWDYIALKKRLIQELFDSEKHVLRILLEHIDIVRADWAEMRKGIPYRAYLIELAFNDLFATKEMRFEELPVRF